jgi:hypothetical protein
MDAPRNSDGQHAPEAPETNTRTPASIFHVNSIWATHALRPNRRCNATMTQTGALQHTAGIEKKTHLGGEFGATQITRQVPGIPPVRFAR